MQRGVAVVLAAALCTAGCAGYSPVRWPRRELWASRTAQWDAIQPLSSRMTEYPQAVQQSGVTVAIKLLSRTNSEQFFHRDLLRAEIQPLFVVIQNQGQDPYLFNKRGVGARAVPATTAAKVAYEHPVVTAARLARWLVCFTPGVLFSSLIEPATGLEFPGIEEAATRPAVPNNRAIQGDFVAHEIVDGSILPDTVRSGFLFIRPPALDSTLPVTLVNERTGSPLGFALQMPPPIYTATRAYEQPYETVWRASETTARQMASWRVVGTDASAGVIRVKTERFLPGWPVTDATITVRPLSDRATSLVLDSTLLGPDSTSMDRHSRTVDRYLEELDSRLPRKQPKRKRRSSGRRKSAATGTVRGVTPAPAPSTSDAVETTVTRAASDRE